MKSQYGSFTFTEDNWTRLCHIGHIDTCHIGQTFSSLLELHEIEEE